MGADWHQVQTGSGMLLHEPCCYMQTPLAGASQPNHLVSGLQRLGDMPLSLGSHILFGCNNQFPHSLDMVPKGRLGLSLCAGPPVTRSTSDRGNVYRGIMVDIEAKGVKFPYNGNYMQFP